MQIVDALPSDAGSIADVAAQLMSLALDRASASHAEEVRALQSQLAERDARVTELEARCDELSGDASALAQVLADCAHTVHRHVHRIWCRQNCAHAARSLQSAC